MNPALKHTDSRLKKSPARPDASPAERRAALRAELSHLDDIDARAVRALLAIEQLHLTEFTDDC